METLDKEEFIHEEEKEMFDKLVDDYNLNAELDEEAAWDKMIY